MTDLERDLLRRVEDLEQFIVLARVGMDDEWRNMSLDVVPPHPRQGSNTR